MGRKPIEAFDYAIGLVSIVVGLAISDLATSLHRLIRHRNGVAWDPRPMLAAAFAFIVLFSMWFDLWSIRSRPEILTYPFLLSIVVELVLLSLMATSVLPDEPLPSVDLAAFYQENARPIWSFFLLFQVSYVAHWFYFSLTSSDYSLDRMLARVPETLMVPIAASLLVIMPRKRSLHLVVIALLLFYWLFTFYDHRIAT